MARPSNSSICRIILLALAAVILAGGAAFLAGRAAASPGALPGSEMDPLVSKSYVDRLAQWQLVTLDAGRTLIASQGTEIILRAGQVKAIASAGGGLADVTEGKDLGNLEAVRPNHLLVVPKSDGRGLQAVTQAILLVRGDYQIP